MNTIRIAFAAGNRLRAWETDCIRWLRGIRGVELVGWAGAPDSGERARDRWSQRRFRAWEREAEENSILKRVRQGLRDTGLPFLERLSHDMADVVLLLGGATPPTDLQAHWPRQCWAFAHGDGAPADAALPALREGVLAELHAGFQLVETRTGGVLTGCRVPLDTDPRVTAGRVAELAAHWPADTVRAWLASGHPPEGRIEQGSPPLRIPGMMDMLRFQWRRLTGAPPMNVSSPTGEWNIGVLHQPIHVLLRDDGSRNVRWLPNPSKGMARMEPFGYLDQNGELNAMYRKLREDGSESVIARVRPKPDNILKRSRTMLETGDDLGYPCTVTIDGRPHAVISEPKRREVLLLPVNEDNDGFGEGQVLLGLALHSPTLFEHQGRWWLMGTRAPYPDAQLHAYYAPGPRGPFTEQACSPMKCDLRHARPAGTPFVHHGQLYRPALDATQPGHLAVWINRVDALDPERFSEVPVQRIAGFEATAYGQGVRTLSAIGQVTLVDGLRSPMLDGDKANAQRDRSRQRRRKDRTA